jgi:hypothetical protein
VAHLKAWARWQMAAGPWRGWALCPALTVATDGEPAHPPVMPQPIPEQVQAALANPGTALVLDLEPSQGVRIAAAISRRGLAHVALVLPRWPDADAVLPVVDLLAVLVSTSRELRQAEVASNVVFVVDAERQMQIRHQPRDTRVDNRYALSAGDLPSLATLRRAGIQRIVKVARQT